jgi:hypothetical protein
MNQAVEVSVRVAHAGKPEQCAWLSMRVERRDDQHVLFDADVATALARDPVSFMHPLSPAQATVLKAEIVGGILMARKQAGRVGCRISLRSIGGSDGEVRNVITLPSVAYAVASTLAVLQGLGVEDLLRAPRGGFGWTLVRIEQTPVES